MMLWTRCATRTMLAARAMMTAALAMLVVSGCGLLDVSNPTRLEEDELGNSASALMLRIDAIQQLSFALSSDAKLSGLMADELFSDPNPSDVLAGLPMVEQLADRRESELLEPLFEGSWNSPYFSWQATRKAASVALPFVRGYISEPARSAYVTQVLAIRGYVALTLAEHYCPGFPLNDVQGNQLVRRPPMTTQEAFEHALADFDSAVALNTDSARYLNLAKIGQARALLGLGRFAEAGTSVAGIPTEYVYQIDYQDYSQPNGMYFDYGVSSGNVSPADREGGTGLDYVSAHDPRVVLYGRGIADNGVDSIYGITQYNDISTPMVLANGIEARLIEAEAALAGGGDWLGILNELRRDHVEPVLADTTDPGTDAARQDLLFRERAFWLYGTGHRLGDLRRLVAHYGRTAESVFPTGIYRTGDVYATATSIPFPGAKERADNPAITGCTSR